MEEKIDWNATYRQLLDRVRAIFRMKNGRAVVLCRTHAESEFPAEGERAARRLISAGRDVPCVICFNEYLEALKAEL